MSSPLAATARSTQMLIGKSRELTAYSYMSSFLMRERATCSSLWSLLHVSTRTFHSAITNYLQRDFSYIIRRPWIYSMLYRHRSTTLHYVIIAWVFPFPPISVSAVRFRVRFSFQFPVFPCAYFPGHSCCHFCVPF